VPIESPVVSYVVFALAFVFEGSSWLVSLKQFSDVKGEIGFIDAIKLSKESAIIYDAVRNSIALIGILIAAASTFAAVALGYPQIDGSHLSRSVCY